MGMQRVLLSRSAAGKAILVTGTSAATATLVHQALPGEGALDEVYIKAANNHSEPVRVTVLWGDDDPEDLFSQVIPPRDGRIDLVQGDCLGNAQAIKVYASVADVISITGHVNRILNE